MDEKALKRALDYMRDWLRYRYEREDIPGFVVAVAYKGKILFNEAYGFADMEKKIKLTPQHIFRIASHSKTFTATAIMQLQERRKLEIDDPVMKYLPWLKEHKDKRFQKITIRQLLSHGAGVIRDGTDHGYWALEEPFPNREELERDVLKADLVLDNNTKMKYSNYGYGLLGLIIESVSGQEYNDYVTDNIVKPLGLRDTGPEFSPEIEDRLVTGYSRAEIDNKRLPISNIGTHALSPATGFYSTAGDMCKYFTAHMVSSGELLEDESKKEMQRVHWQAKYMKDKREYGLGLELEHEGKQNIFGHSGGFPGHSTKSMFQPEDELVVVTLTNSMRSGASHINHSIFNLIYYFQKHSKENRKALRKYEGRLMSFWSTADVLVAGDKLKVGDPNSWEPFEYPDILKHEKGDVFKIAKTSSFASLGELVQFNIRNNKVESALYAGEKMLPEKDYMKMISGKKKIG